MSTFQLTEGIADPNGTRTFEGVAPSAGKFVGFTISADDLGWIVVPSATLGGVEKLSHNYLADGLHAAQANGSLAYGDVALNDAIVLKASGDVSSVSATIE